MKNLFVVGLVVFGVCSAQAAKVINCVVTVKGQPVENLSAFDIDGYDTETPEASIDGGLVEYKLENNKVYMSFSNECDNSYELTFSAASIEKAKNGIYKRLIGKAKVEEAGNDVDVTGVVTCQVVN